MTADQKAVDSCFRRNDRHFVRTALSGSDPVQIEYYSESQKRNYSTQIFF
ncbi:Uncharacterized protein dnm_029870 [Desulfonema magnum]|uniref:Uncharacterized protein n=1 Tax=Desulfonema magnum TaxID=45655 RepID=A0A975BK82_9BACT|nr:Uncharacterized protein dnm_029870 [Desulfonema magnum]